MFVNQQRAGRRLRIGVASLVLLFSAAAPVNAVVALPAKACPPTTVGGKAVGKITVDGVKVLIKKVRMAADGSLDSVPSNLVASVVTDWQPLNAKFGTTVLLWHSRFGVGCEGTLNTLFGKRAGDGFSVTDAKGVTRKYVISSAATVKKGNYWDDWFAGTVLARSPSSPAPGSATTSSPRTTSSRPCLPESGCPVQPL